jgi:RNA polymerase primary sigma factor
MAAKKLSAKQLEKELQNLEGTDADALALEIEKEEARKAALERADKRIRRSKVASGTISMYLAEISQYEPLSPDREVELAVQIAKGDQNAMKELVEANLRFVVSVAKKYQGNGLSLSDIINEGNLGLIKAAKRFDPSRGFKFISYAVWWIRQAILQALAEQGRLIRLPLNRVGTITKITKAAEKLEAEMGRPPKVEEISHQLDIKTEEVFNALQYSRRHSSLDAPFAEGEDSSLINVIEDQEERDPDNTVMDTSMKEEIASALSTLTERERSVIEMYFGINRDRSFTLNEIGEQFSLTRERVRQIKEKAIRRLAHKTRSEPLRVYLGQ